MIKGIIFDMDNTLLRSTIDFQTLKWEVFEFLVAEEILSEKMDITQHTSSTLIKEALQANLMTASQIEQMWEIVERVEVKGMQDADLELGVLELLEHLAGNYRLVVITNNSNKAAHAALTDNGIIHYFDSIIARESMATLKPSPAGFLAVLNQFKDTSAEQWISIGDAWIDGRAAMDAGIKFIAYQADLHKMSSMGVVPAAAIHDIRQLSVYL